ncbi:MAG TPA: hypothetical protein VFU35_09250 [Jatrophihabitans sp.]|nr:hypothetical protein [Jatrophihabitans sp.]
MTEYRDPPSSPLPSDPATAAPPSPSPYGPSASYSEPVLTATEAPPPAPGGGTITGGARHTSDSDPSMKDKAADSAQAGKQAAGEVAQTATDKAKDVAQEAKTQARNIAGQAQDQLREQASNQHRNLVSTLRSLGDQLNSMADRSDESGPATDLVGEAGSRAHNVASWLDEREPAQLLDELRSFARRKPGVFLLGALAAGVVAGRLTRGVVAAHQDDDDTVASSRPQVSSPYTATPEPNGPLANPYLSGSVDRGPAAGVYSADPVTEVRP